MRVNHATLIRALPADELENFVNVWLRFRCKEYVSHELWRGTGDMGRDVTGYVSDRRMEGPWDNFQCKQLNTSLSEPSAFLELAKIFMHSADGEYSLPRAYIFVAPRGVARGVQKFVAHPAKFKKALVDRWDTDIAHRLVEKRKIFLSPEIEAKIASFDFINISWIDAARLAEDDACLPALVEWFGADPGPAPKGSVPDGIEASESVYISQLLALYTQRGPGVYLNAAAALASSEFGAHLRDQRTRYFDSVAFDRFFRDSTPEEYLKDFKEQIYHGVVETYNDVHADGFTRLRQVMKQAANVQAAGVLGKHAAPQVKQGTCHQFANGDRLPWHP